MAGEDVGTAVLREAPGVILTRETEAALVVAAMAGSLTGAQVLAITGPAPSYPAGLPRFPGSNPCPRDQWVKYPRGL